VNTEAVRNIAKACKTTGAALIHYSTDYVYNGHSDRSYTEIDSTDPLSEYGKAKMAAEKLIPRYLDRYFIFRLSTVWDFQHKNFVTRLIHRFRKDPEISIPNLWSNPCYAPDVAIATIQVIKRLFLDMPKTSGVYNMVPPNFSSRVYFAQALLDGLKSRGSEVATERINVLEGVLPGAPRPVHSNMSADKLKVKAKVVMPKWEQALARALDEAQTHPNPVAFCPDRIVRACLCPKMIAT
jgi:dTDP-4-dehydrorhamnose reductase